MADFSSASPSTLEIMKFEENKVIIAPQLNTPHSVGLHVPIKLTRENFLLWKTQLFPLLNCHGLAHILMQDPPISSRLDDRGEIVVNTAYQTWWRQDQPVPFRSSLMENYFINMNTRVLGEPILLLLLLLIIYQIEKLSIP